MRRMTRGSRSTWLACAVLLLFAGAWPAASASSPGWVRWKLDPTPDPAYFGIDAVVSGNTVAVGTNGAVYLFVRVPGGWRQQARLVSPDPSRRQFFGQLIDLDGDTLAVGAGTPFDDIALSGLAHIFMRSPETGAWSFQTTLRPPEPAGIVFGGPVAISGDLLAVGAVDLHGGPGGEGRVYVFRRQGTDWSLEDTLIVPLLSSLSLSGGTLAAGEPFAPPNVAGAVRLFVREPGGWRQQAVLQSPDLDNPPGGNQFGFGTAVAVDGNTLLASATAGSPRFRTYVFVRRGDVWRHQATLIDPQPQYHGFGWSVALEGDRAVVGAFGGPSGPRSFAIGYVYVRTGRQWRLEDRLVAPDVRPINNFGALVDLSGDRVVIVAGPQGGSGVPPGAAYVFERRARPESAD